jgi:hypothetical protein
VEADDEDVGGVVGGVTDEDAGDVADDADLAVLLLLLPVAAESILLEAWRYGGYERRWRSLDSGAAEHLEGEACAADKGAIT